MALFQHLIKRSPINRSNPSLSSLTDRQLEDLGVERANVGQRVRANSMMLPIEAWPSK
jgi:uncharacterized protein YjiS (DUF1127 family)